jgi:hypothetical protein
MAGGGPSADDDESTALETVLARTSSLRHRALQLGALVSALAVVGVLLARQFRAAPPASPQPTPSGPGVLTVIESNTTWGMLTVNGRRLPGPPPQTATLRGTDNVVTLDALPFITYDMPRRRGDIHRHWNAERPSQLGRMWRWPVERRSGRRSSGHPDGGVHPQRK